MPDKTFLWRTLSAANQAPTRSVNVLLESSFIYFLEKWNTRTSCSSAPVLWRIFSRCSNFSSVYLFQIVYLHCVFIPGWTSVRQRPRLHVVLLIHWIGGSDTASARAVTQSGSPSPGSTWWHALFFSRVMSCFKSCNINIYRALTVNWISRRLAQTSAAVILTRQSESRVKLRKHRKVSYRQTLSLPP